MPENIRIHVRNVREQECPAVVEIDTDSEVYLHFVGGAKKNRISARVFPNLYIQKLVPGASATNLNTFYVDCIQFYPVDERL